MKANEQQRGNQDLLKAKTLLVGRRLSLCIVKDGKTLFESRRQGIASFLDAINYLGCELENTSVADKIVGRAVALLCIRSKISSVYADVMSKGAKALFQGYSMRFESTDFVDNVLNIDKKRVCPFELLVERVTDPDEAYKVLTHARDLRRFN